MSTISKMMILGVRAFPTEYGETIKFDTPLTLVAGINGSGKTTIIECLRFATTGALPPGAGKQGAWIHDPGLQGDKQVLAQVKLMFHAANGTRLVATRNLELAVKKTARTQKTKEASLLIDRNGQKMTLSTRVAELDQQVPLYLGVSTSLLDNVIFCHQEDSQWPLAESSTLKKKFDEIFEAGKYTKAVKELLDIRKKHRADLGRQEEVERGAFKDRARARKVHTSARTLEEEITGLREEVAELDEKIKTTGKEAQEAWNKAAGFVDVLSRLNDHRNKANHLEATLKSLKPRLREVAESDEWLRQTLSEFDTTLVRYGEDRDNKREQYLEYGEEIDELKEKLDAKLDEQGQHKQAKTKHDQQLQQRKIMVKQSATKHQIRGYDDVNDDQVPDFLFKLRKISKDHNQKLQVARQDADRQKDEAITSVNRLHERQKVLKDNRITTSRSIAENNRQVGQRQSEADSIKVNEGNREIVESRREELQTRLQNARETLKTTDYQSKISKAETEVASLEEEINSLSSEQKQASKRAGEVAALSHAKQQVKEKERSLQTLLKVHTNSINGILGSDWNAGTLESKHKAQLADAAKSVTAAENERDSGLREAEQIKYKQKTLSEELTTRTRQAKEHKVKVEEVIDRDITEYEEASKSAQEELDAIEVMKQNEGIAKYFRKVLEVAEQQNCCRLCDRKFKGPQDAQLLKVKSRAQGYINQASSGEDEEQIEEAIKEQKSILAIATRYENWVQLTKEEIPKLDKQVKALEKDNAKLLAQIERHDKEVEQKKFAQREIETLATSVSSIVKTEQERQDFLNNVEVLSAEQSQHGDIRTLEEIQEQIDNVQTKLQEARKIVNRFSREQTDAKAEIYATDLELKDREKELGNISQQLERKSNVLGRIQELKDINQKLRGDIDKMDSELETIGPEIETAKTKREHIDQQTNTQLQDLTEQARSYDDTLNKLGIVEADIEKYLEAGGDSNLTNTGREIERIRQETKQLEAARTQVMKEIARLEEQLKDSDHTRQQYADNLQYREDTRTLTWLRGQIEEIEAKNIEHDQDRLMERSRQKENEKHKHAATREGVVAECKAKDRQLAELLSEYDTDLKDAARRYKEAHIKFNATKAAIEDIGKYSTALDQAVTKYHSLKMEQVNTIIDELWRATYQGSDVDTIYIKSDLEVKANTRSHNYRVVMLKRDVELDMRGRCSAGQKVLASIIIRLALAECFSKDCGVIALDEPTTNLDEKNIEALALSLHRIIDTRRHQKNFQLIVITHDERFLELMNCADFTDHYWHIRRNEKDCSVIEKNSILAVMRK